MIVPPAYHFALHRKTGAEGLRKPTQVYQFMAMNQSSIIEFPQSLTRAESRERAPASPLPPHSVHCAQALLFSDVVGYSRLMAKDEVMAVWLLTEYRRIVTAGIRNGRGKVVEYIGDAVLARFAQAKDAVQAALAIQVEISRFNQQLRAKGPAQSEAFFSERPRSSLKADLQVRIGVHQGIVGLRGNTVFGDDVSIVAELEALAVPGSVCMSAAVFDAVQDDLAGSCKSLGVRRAGGMNRRIPAFLVRPGKIRWTDHLHYFVQSVSQCLLGSGYRAATLALTFLAVLLGSGYWSTRPSTANYVEVSDFRNLMDATGASNYFSAGVTEAIRAQLSSLPQLYTVKSEQGVFAPVKLDGTIQQTGDHLRISYTLVRRKDGVQIGGGKLDGATRDIFLLQDRVTAAIAQLLAEEFGLPAVRPAPLTLTANVTAYDFYLQGRGSLQEPLAHAPLDLALNAFSTALVLDNDFVLANVGMCQAYSGKFQLTGASDWLGLAHPYCTSAHRQSAEDPVTLEALGTIYRDTGDYDKAFELLHESIETDPSRASPYIALARLYSLNNQDEAAEATFKIAARKDPANWMAHQEYGAFLSNSGRHREAINQFAKVLEITPDNVAAHNGTGAAHLYLGEFSDAAQAFTRSVDLVPRASTWSNSGVMHFFAGDYRRASQMFAQAVAMEPDNYRWLTNHADALRQLRGRSEEARALYTRAITSATLALQTNPKDVVALRHLAICHFFLEEYETANVYLDRALAIDPDNINSQYQALRIMALTGNIKEAIAHSHQLVHMGYSKELIASDPDLASLNQRRDVNLADIRP